LIKYLKSLQNWCDFLQNYSYVFQVLYSILIKLPHNSPFYNNLKINFVNKMHKKYFLHFYIYFLLSQGILNNHPEQFKINLSNYTYLIAFIKQLHTFYYLYLIIIHIFEVFFKKYQVHLHNFLFFEVKMHNFRVN
jgi:hypothetical protein